MATAALRLTGNIAFNRGNGTVVQMEQVGFPAHVITSGRLDSARLPSDPQILGNLTPVANVLYDLGSATHRWKDLWLSGNTIVLGNTFIREGADQGVQFGGASTTVTADSFAGNGAALTHLDASQITSGTVPAARFGSNVKIGEGAGLTQPFANIIAIGVGAGASYQGTGWFEGALSEGGDAIAIGRDAGAYLQGEGSVAIGLAAGSMQQGKPDDPAGDSYVGNAVAIGIYAGSSSQGFESIAIGSCAGNLNQGIHAVSIGSSAGTLNQAWNAVAVGHLAGSNIQGLGAVAVGDEAGKTSQGQDAVAVGTLSGCNMQGMNATAVGRRAGNNSQGWFATAVGFAAGCNMQGTQAVAVGLDSGRTSQGAFATAVGVNAGYTNQGDTAVAVGRSAGLTNQGSCAVAVGYAAGGTSQGSCAVAVGSSAGRTLQGNLSVAVGYAAGETSQGTSSVAIGHDAGRTSQGINAVALGSGAGANVQATASVAIGLNAGSNTQRCNAVAIGSSAGQTSQDEFSVAIGREAGQTSQGRDAVAVGRRVGQISQGSTSVAIGYLAGQTSQGSCSVAIGRHAASNMQGTDATAVGYQAASDTQGTRAVAIGHLAGQTAQGNISVAIGAAAGLTSQKNLAVAIGSSAGYVDQNSGAMAIGSCAARWVQGVNAVAVGSCAGYSNQGSNAVAIGFAAGFSNQAANCIVINATGLALENTTANSCVIKPVRDVASVSRRVALYDSTSGEVSTNSANFVLDASNRVGIGTTSPEVPLHVNGSVQVGLGVTSDSTYGLQWGGGYGIIRTSGPWTAPNYQQLKLGWATGIILDPGTAYGKSYVDIVGNGLRVTSGNVGIGTAAPAYTLDVSGTARITSNLFFNNQVQNNMITLYGSTGLADTGQYGFGVNGGTLRYNSGSLHRWYCGTSQALTLGFDGVASTPYLELGPSTSPTMIFRDTDHRTGYIHINSNLWYILCGPNNAGPTGWAQVANSRWPFFINLSNNNAEFGGDVRYISAGVYSDRRIKKDFRDLDDEESLRTLRTIEPVAYKYIDAAGRGLDANVETIGFVAQQIESVLPHAVSTSKGVVPSVYAYGTTDAEDQTIVQLDTDEVPFDVGDLVVVHTSEAASCHVRCVAKPTARSFQYAHITEPGSVEGPISSATPEQMPGPGEPIFVYGHEVSDFKSIKKDVVFTVALAATQEMDRQLQDARAKIAVLETQNSSFEARLAALESQ